MNSFERESLDRHITGNYGADQLREDEWEDATLAGLGPEEPEQAGPQTYRVYLTEKQDDSPHPVETVDLIGGLTTSAAFEMCFALNEGGKLRDGIEAHFATEEDDG